MNAKDMYFYLARSLPRAHSGSGSTSSCHVSVVSWTWHSARQQKRMPKVHRKRFLKSSNSSSLHPFSIPLNDSFHIPFSSFSSSAPCHSRPHPESDSAPHVLPSLLARPWCLQASASRPSRHRSNADLPRHRNSASLRQRHQWHGATEWKATFLKSVKRC